MKVTRGLTVHPKVKGRKLSLTFKWEGAPVLDRRRPRRPVWRLADIKARLPFKLDFGRGLTGQPKVLLKVYWAPKSDLARTLANRNTRRIQ